MEERLDDAINILRNHAEAPILPGSANYHANLTQLDSHVVSLMSLSLSLSLSLVTIMSCLFPLQPSPSSDSARTGLAPTGQCTPTNSTHLARCDSAPPPPTGHKKAASARSSTPNATSNS